MSHAADKNSNAAVWDDPRTHIDLVAQLRREYDSFAVAIARDSLPVYLSVWPDARVAVWHNPAAWPPGNRIHATFELVLLHIHAERRAIGSGAYVKDCLTAIPPREKGFIGAKPRAWTRWVLDMLAYDPDADSVTDMFRGSGAVSAEIDQQVLVV